MRLDELIIKDPKRYTPSDATNTMSYVDMEKVLARSSTAVVRTDHPGLKLVVARQFGPNISVYILSRSKPRDSYDAEHVVHHPKLGYLVGFVNLMRPTPLKNGPAFAKNVYTPHSGLMGHMIGRGYMKAVYKWVLEGGNHLVTGHEQTPSSNALWKSLAGDFDVMFIDSSGKTIDTPTPEEAQRPDVRMVLLGNGKQEIFK